jgi:hypothetical protein
VLQHLVSQKTDSFQEPLDQPPVGEDEEDVAPYRDYTPSQQKLWDAFGPVCHFIPHETKTPVINKVDMTADTAAVDYADTASLQRFCAPYVYSRLVVDVCGHCACRTNFAVGNEQGVRRRR